MNNNFKQSLALVLKEEGGFANHPSDPGGRTLHGITQRVYDAYRSSKGLTPVVITAALAKDLTWVKHRDDIYFTQYWRLAGCDRLPSGIDLFVFDFAVNSGVSRSVKYLQRVLGAKQDGVIGAVTLKAAKDADALQVIRKLSDSRLAFLRGLKTWGTFGKGWQRRVDTVTKEALKLGGVAVASLESVSPKALDEDFKKLPSNKPADGLILGGGLTAAVQELQPFQGIPAVDKILVIVAVIGVISLLVGLAWRFWNNRKEKERNDLLS